MSETKAVKLVERGHIPEGIVALIGDLHLAEQFLLRAGQFVNRQPFRGQFVDLIEQSGLDRFDFCRVCPEIKEKKPGDASLHLAGADGVGGAHLFADADKKTRTQIAARLIDQFKRVSIRAERAGAPKTNTYN